MQAGVFGFVDNAHATAAEFFENAVVGDDSAKQGVSIRHWWLILSLVGAQVNAGGIKMVGPWRLELQTSTVSR